MKLPNQSFIRLMTTVNLSFLSTQARLFIYSILDKFLLLKKLSKWEIHCIKSKTNHILLSSSPGFRNKKFDGLSGFDLEHILWQVGKTSSDNITTLLSELTRTRFHQESSVPANVHSALPQLQKWLKGNHAINPAVTLSLHSDDLCKEDMYFFKGRVFTSPYLC